MICKECRTAADTRTPALHCGKDDCMCQHRVAKPLPEPGQPQP